jgi:hypothetical protein
MFGVGLPAFNITGPVQYIKKPCKGLLASSSVNTILLADSGSCAHSKIARNAAKAGYGGVIVLENKKFKAKPDLSTRFPVPVVVVDNKKKTIGKQLRQADGVLCANLSQ